MANSEGLMNHERLFFLETHAINQSLIAADKHLWCAKQQIWGGYIWKVTAGGLFSFLLFSLLTQRLSEFTVFPVSSQSFCPEVSAYLNNERELTNHSLALLKAQLYPALAFCVPWAAKNYCCEAGRDPFGSEGTQGPVVLLELKRSAGEGLVSGTTEGPKWALL